MNAPTHLERLGGQPPRPILRVLEHDDLVLFLDQSVALLTFHLRVRHEVSVVPELDVLRKPVDLEPLDRLLLVPVVLEGSNPRKLVVAGWKLTVKLKTPGRCVRRAK